MTKFYIIFLLFIWSTLTFSQSTDSLNHIIIGNSVIRDSSKVLVDSLKAVDTLATDTTALIHKIIIPIAQLPLSDSVYYLLSHRDILYNDYRYAGDFFNRFSFSFLRDLGSSGQPQEILIYGAGINSNSYLNNGEYLNSRLTNSFDLRDISSESSDSIEILPSYKGFIYGPFNNEAAVNLINKEHFLANKKRSPYTRLRYYQAPNEEAAVDALFHSYITRQLAVSAGMANNSQDDGFPNTNYGSWKFRFNINYFLSDQFNISADYLYSKSQVGLYGGINEDSLQSLAGTGQANTYPVRFQNRYEKFSFNNLSLSLRNKLTQDLSGNITLFYYSNILQFRQNENGELTNAPVIINNNRAKTSGVTFREIYQPGFIRLDVSAGYEYNSLKAEYLTGTQNIHSIYASGTLGLNLFGRIYPSFFYKNLIYDGHIFIGLGADIYFKLPGNVSLYAGLSQFDRPLTPVEQYFNYSDSTIISNDGFRISKQRKTIRNAEAGLKYDHSFIASGVKIFLRTVSNESFAILNSFDIAAGFIQQDEKFSGAGLDLKFNLRPIYFEGHAAYYYGERNSIRKYMLPEFTFDGGVYYRDTLFKKNLFLKTGFYFTAGGRQNFYLYDFEKSLSAYYFLNNGTVSDNSNYLKAFWQIDFTLIAEIQRRAILYFTFENLLDKKYYIVPYHQMRGRGLRIGVAWEFLN